jgi:hypothetical protein
VFERTIITGWEKRQRRASSLRTWRWRAQRSSCPSSPAKHPPYVPRPSALDHLDRDMLQRPTCSRTATSCMWCPVCTSGALMAERGGCRLWMARSSGFRLGRHDEQAACEPDGGGRGGVPVHPARLRSHRTSRAQALLIILSRHAATLTCPRTATSCVRCPACTSGSLRAERGWVTAVNGAQQWI